MQQLPLSPHTDTHNTPCVCYEVYIDVVPTA